MLKLIIAEDEEIIRRGLITTIDWAAMGAEVIGDAADGMEAWALIHEKHPDIILTDIRMPRLSGLQLAERLHAEKNPAHVIFLTSYADFSYAQRAVRVGACDYLLKPVEEEDLMTVLQRIRLQMQAPAPAASGSVGKISLVDWLPLLAGAHLNPHVREVLEFLATHYQERLSVEEMAARQGVSASYLSRKLKETTGHTFNSLLTRFRLQQSLALLAEGRLRVYEVAEAVGFSDYKNYAQVFRKYLDMTPSQYVHQEGEAVQTMP